MYSTATVDARISTQCDKASARAEIDKVSTCASAYRKAACAARAPICMRVYACFGCRWYFVLAMCYMCNKPDVVDLGCQIGVPSFPPPQTVATQTAGAGGLGKGGGTRGLPGQGFYSGIGEFQDYFRGILKQALELSVEDMSKGSWRMSERMLVEQISFFYSRKVIMDQIDDRESRPRQHLAFFIYDYYISMTKTALEGSSLFLKLIANVVQYLPRPEIMTDSDPLSEPPGALSPLGKASAVSLSDRPGSGGGTKSTQSLAGLKKATNLKKMAAKFKSSVQSPTSPHSAADGAGTDAGSSADSFGGPDALAARRSSPTLSPTDPVPHGLLTLCPWASSGPQGLYTAYIQPIYSLYAAYIQPIYRLCHDYPSLHRRAAAEQKFRTEKWISEMRVDKSHLLRIETFANLIGANSTSRWDLGMHFEASDVYLEALLRIRKGHTPLLPYETAESGKEILVPTVDMLSAVESVCSKMKAVDRQKIKVDLEASLKVKACRSLPASLSLPSRHPLHAHAHARTHTPPAFAGSPSLTWSYAVCPRLFPCPTPSDLPLSRPPALPLSLARARTL